MSAEPFRSEVRGRVLHLWLDTPHSPINVLTVDAAAQLLELVKDAESEPLDVIALRSAKRGSFINGVGLMMATVAKSPADVDRIAAPIRLAYRAVRESPLTTIAVVDGSCFGCGLELAMQADYRIATDAHDTRFRLTEVEDYLFIPAFGATQDLPRLVGLDAAADLLLWGDHWTAPVAHDHGLVDAVIPYDDIDAGLDRFMESPHKRARPVKSEDARDVAALRQRIAALPPAVQPVYTLGADLLQTAVESGPDYRSEQAACAETVTAPIAKNALAFFFARQSAAVSSQRDYVAPDTLRVPVEESVRGRLEPAWTRTRLRDVVLEPPRPGGWTADNFLFGYRTELPAEPWVYLPGWSLGIRLAEVGGSASDPFVRTSVDALARLGLVALHTHAGGRSVANTLLDGFFRAVGSEGSAAEWRVSLRDFGFDASLERWRKLLATAHPVGKQDDENGKTSVNPRILEAAREALETWVREAERDNCVPHRSILDVMARELLGFPLSRGALTDWLRREAPE